MNRQSNISAFAILKAMLSAFLPVALTLLPFIIILVVVYLVLGKKVAHRSAIILAIILLVLVVSALFFVPPSSNKNATTTAGEKAAAQAIKQDYPGIQYSVTGRVADPGGQTFNEYRIQLATDYDETGYQKLNKDVCERLKDETARIITSSSERSSGPQLGVAGTCRHWLDTN